MSAPSTVGCNQHRRFWTREAILEAFAAEAQLLGRTPSAEDLVAAKKAGADVPSLTPIYNHFDSLAALAIELGMTPAIARRGQGGGLKPSDLCRAGLHLMTPDNVEGWFNEKSGYTHRRCIECRRAYARGVRKASARPRMVTRLDVCRAGLHQLTPGNVDVNQEDGRSRRRCKECRRQKNWERRETRAKMAGRPFRRRQVAVRVTPAHALPPLAEIALAWWSRPVLPRNSPEDLCAYWGVRLAS